MVDKHTFTLAAGTRLHGVSLSAALRADVLITCDAEDVGLLRAALQLPDSHQPASTCAKQFGSATSIAEVSAAALPKDCGRHSGCLHSGQEGPFAQISLLSNEGRCMQCISTIGGPARCR